MRRVLYLVTLIGLFIAVPSRAQPAETEAQLMARGARVWAQNCTRCHNARSAFERNDRDWLTIVAHMRARANLTRGEAEAVAAFMKATNAPEGRPQSIPPSPEVTEETPIPKSSAVTSDDHVSSRPTSASGSLSVAEVRALVHFLHTVR